MEARWVGKRTGGSYSRAGGTKNALFAAGGAEEDKAGLLASLESFLGREQAQDDLTLVILERQAQGDKRNTTGHEAAERGLRTCP
jgi:hypothetical protein